MNIINRTQRARFYARAIIYGAVLCLVASSNTYSQISFKDNYQMVCHCQSDDYTPDHIVSLGNNLELLLKLRTPMSAAELSKSGVSFDPLQLETLKKWNLVCEENRMLHTNFVILNDETATEFYDEIAQLSMRLTDELQPEFTAFDKILWQHGLGSHSFSLIFSYVLDHHVWNSLETKQLIHRQEATGGRPWIGEFWMTNRSRSSVYGTSSLKRNDVTLMVNWTDESLDALKLLLGDTEILEEFLDKVSANERIRDASLYRNLKHLGFMGKRGQHQIAVLDEDRHAAITHAALALGDQVANWICQLPLQGLATRYGFNSNQQAAVIVYHELMLEIMERLNERNVLSRRAPEAVNRHNPAIIGNTFLVKHSTSRGF